MFVMLLAPAVVSERPIEESSVHALPAQADEAGVEASLSVRGAEGFPTAVGRWDAVPNPMNTEIALSQFSIAVEDATVMAGDHYVAPDKSRRVRIRRFGLGDGHVIEMADRDAGRSCAVSTPATMVDLGAVQVFAADAPGGVPAEGISLVTVEDRPDVGMLISSSPGDTVEVRRVSHGGRPMREVMTIHHGAEELVLDRRAEWQRVCFGTVR